jgi:sugar lactone lactonase YvrE
VHHKARVVAAVATASVCAIAAMAPAVAGARTTVVATGLNNPRGLALAPDGTLYVAVAGRGGRLGCIGRGEDRQCIGTTGRVVSIKNGTKTIVARGLVSAASRDGTFATGPDAVSVGPDGRVVTVITSGTRRDIASTPRAVRSQFGTLVQVAPGATTTLASISPFEWEHNVDRVKGDRNSNPYGVLALDGHTLVADAGANAIFDVRGSTVSLFAVIPKNRGQQPVPTSLALGPDGNVYVGELALGAGRGKARVWKIPQAGGTPTQVATGFTAITGLAFGPDGSMYVTELSLNLERGRHGAVVKVAPDGTRTTISESNLMFPAGAAADATGVYVSAFSTLPSSTPRRSPFKGAGGEVVKITP